MAKGKDKRASNDKKKPQKSIKEKRKLKKEKGAKNANAWPFLVPFNFLDTGFSKQDEILFQCKKFVIPRWEEILTPFLQLH